MKTENVTLGEYPCERIVIGLLDTNIINDYTINFVILWDENNAGK